MSGLVSDLCPSWLMMCGTLHQGFLLLWQAQERQREEKSLNPQDTAAVRKRYRKELWAQPGGPGTKLVDKLHLSLAHLQDQNLPFTVLEGHLR